MQSWTKATRRLGKIVVDDMTWRYRRLTWHYRYLPDFLIVGAQKSGTTSLYDYLSQHPQLLPSFEKEVHYFNGGLLPTVDIYKKGTAWYRANFPVKRKADAQAITFEASPLYLFNPLVPKRIFDLLPQVKLIVLLRNPTDRAISHYFHERRLNREPLPIYDAFQAEEERLQETHEQKDYQSEVFKNHSYKSRGLYKVQLERYCKYFNRSQLLIINSEDFFSNPRETLEKVFDFVGVDSTFRNRNYKNRSFSRNKTQVAPEVYQYLDDYFRPHNQELYALLGRDFGW